LGIVSPTPGKGSPTLGTVSPTPEDTSLTGEIIRFACTKIPDGKYSKIFNTIPLIPFFLLKPAKQSKIFLQVLETWIIFAANLTLPYTFLYRQASPEEAFFIFLYYVIYTIPEKWK
jgi:hypothetical protein